MNGYVALERVRPHGVRAATWRRAGIELTVPSAFETALQGDLVLPGDPRPVRERLGERWAIVREQWTITTFYLFDPESWR
jgi:hypothetical protein